MGTDKFTFYAAMRFNKLVNFNIKITSFFFEIKTKKPNGKQKLNLLLDLYTISSMFARMAYKSYKANQ